MSAFAPKADVAQSQNRQHVSCMQISTIFLSYTAVFVQPCFMPAAHLFDSRFPFTAAITRFNRILPLFRVSFVNLLPGLYLP